MEPAFDKLRKYLYICLVLNGGDRPREVDGRNRESGGGYESDSGAVPAAVIPRKASVRQRVTVAMTGRPTDVG